MLFYLQIYLFFFTFTLGAGKIKETTRNKRYGRAQVHVWHNLFDIDSLNICCIGNFFSGIQFNCDRFLLLSHWICSLRNFQQAIWISGPVINMPVPRFTGFLRMEIVQPKGDSFTCWKIFYKEPIERQQQSSRSFSLNNIMFSLN